MFAWLLDYRMWISMDQEVDYWSILQQNYHFILMYFCRNRVVVPKIKSSTKDTTLWGLNNKQERQKFHLVENKVSSFQSKPSSPQKTKNNNGSLKRK